MSAPTVGRIYGVLLHALPAAFRRRYAAEMRRTLEDHWSASSPFARVGIAVRALVDLLYTAILVRISPQTYETPSTNAGPPTESSLAGISGDARAAVRGLRRRPAFAATAIVTAALGVGATTAVFSVVDATVLRGIGVPQADRVMSLWGTFERSPGREFQISMAEYADIRADVRSFERVGAWGDASVLLEPSGDRDARTVSAALTYGDIYRIVGARTVLGRLPDASDDRLDAQPVAVLSHVFWTTVLGGDPKIVGRTTLPLASQPVIVIGVLAPDVTLPGGATDLWIHRVLDPSSWATNRSGHGLNVIGVLRPSVTEPAARAELATIQRTWASRYPGQHTFGLDGHGVHVMALGDRVLGTARRVGALLSVAAGVLLLLACANVANLLLARGETRVSEVGVRIALGASSRRVAQPVVLEGLVIAAIGGALGLALAATGLPALLRLAPAELASRAAVGIDARVMVFALVVSLVTGVLFALRPAWKAVRLEPATLLRASGRGRSATMRGLRLLVAGQTGLAALLLVGAALFARSLQNLTAVNPGLDPRSRVSVTVSLPAPKYRDAASVIAYYEALQRRAELVGGVTRASFVRNLPLRDNQRSENVIREGEPRETGMVPVTVQLAGTKMLQTLGIPLLEGRDFDATDRVGSTRVALVNRAAAKTLWPNESAIGKRVTATFAPSTPGLITIVGVYGDVRSGGLSSTPSPELVLPLAQAEPWTGWMRGMRLVLQTSTAGASVLSDIRAVLREMDPGVAVEHPTTIEDVVRAGAARERFLAALLAVFATLALVIAAVGVFGVVSFSVARQARELAIRSALGAGRADILRDVLRTNAGVAAAGAVAGGIVAAIAAPALSGFLYDVSPRDGVVLAGAPLALIAVAVLACVVPAVKAMRVPAARALQDAE
jgi:putative ABC transport system permease protein